MTRSALLAAYRAATGLVEPLGPSFLRWRERRGKEDPARLGERLGVAGLSQPVGPLIWLHGASVGEIMALLPLAEALAGRGHRLLMTTGTVNAARVVGGRLPPGVLHQFVPLDLPGAVRRFLDHWRPELAVFAESELWPNLLLGLAKARIPTALVNAHLSARSAARWRRVPGAIRAMLAGVSLALCQTEEDAARFRALGARGVSVAGQVKYDAPPLGADPEALASFQGAVAGRPVWIAASTHRDEDAALLDAQTLLARALPGALAVVVPRQPDSGAALSDAARARGIRAALRSRGEALAFGTDVYVADTLGELGLFYRAARAVFVGKSLVPPGGGQNPIEPAKLGCAVLHGPHVANFADVYAAFDAAGGAVPVAGADGLATGLAALLTDPGRLDATTRAAAGVVAARAGATARILAALGPLLPALP